MFICENTLLLLNVLESTVRNVYFTYTLKGTTCGMFKTEHPKRYQNCIVNP